MRRLGSTDIAAVAALYLPALALELPKNKTASDVFFRLVHNLEVPRNGRMSRGLDMEPWALDYYREHIGEWWRPCPLGEFWTVQHPRFPEFTASPDAFFSGGIVEVKTQSEWARKQWGTPGTSEMANRYLYQCAWLMACCERDETHVLCVFGHDEPAQEGSESEFLVTEPAVYRVERDLEIETMLLGFGQRFVEEFVRTGIPPPVKPAHNRTDAKAILNGQRQGAADEWYERCEERERQLETQRAASAGDEVG